MMCQKLNSDFCIQVYFSQTQRMRLNVRKTSSSEVNRSLIFNWKYEGRACSTCSQNSRFDVQTYLWHFHMMLLRVFRHTLKVAALSLSCSLSNTKSHEQDHRIWQQILRSVQTCLVKFRRCHWMRGSEAWTYSCLSSSILMISQVMTLSNHDIERSGTFTFRHRILTFRKCVLVIWAIVWMSECVWTWKHGRSDGECLCEDKTYGNMGPIHSHISSWRSADDAECIKR